MKTGKGGEPGAGADSPRDQAVQEPTEDLTDTAVSPRHILDLLEHFPTKTRWNRTFRLIHPYPLN